MATKPTYEELEQRVRELELEAEKHKEVERTLHQRAHILSSIKDTIVIITPEMKTIYANQTAKELFGDRPEMFTEPCYRFFKNRDTVCENCPVLKTIQDEKPHKAIMKSYDKNSQEMWRFNTAFPFYDRDGQVIAGIEMVTDYTPQKSTEIALQESEERYRALFENMSDGVAIYEAKNEGEDFTFIDFNKAGERIDSIHKEALIGKGVLEVFSAVQEFGLFDVFKRVWKTGKPEHHPIAMYKDERIAGWRDNFVYKLPSGEIVAIYSDETKRKRAEEALRETRDYLENLFNYANAPIIVWNPEFRIVRFNHAFEHLTGYKGEEVIGRKLSMLFPEASIDESLNKIQHTLSGEYWESVEIPILCKNGDIRVALWNSANIYAEDGTTLLSTIAQGTDISLRKQAEEALRESEEKYRQLADLLPQTVFETDERGDLTFANRIAFDLFGYTSGDFEKGLNALNMLVPEDRDRALENIARVLKGKWLGGTEYTALTKGGNPLPVVIHTSPIIREGKPVGLRGIITDLTELKEAEGALRESEQKYRLLVENANDAIFVAQDGVIKFPNAKTEELTGYSAEELNKIPFVNHIHPDDKEMVLERHKRRLEGEVLASSYPYRAINKTGEELWHLLNSVPITWEGRPATLNFVRDITEAKRLEAQFEQANKMEAIATLAGGVAHEFNNALMGIMGNIELLKMDLPKDERRDRYFGAMKGSGHRMSRLTDQLLAYAQGGKYQPKDLRLDDFVIETLPILQHDLNSAVRLETHFQKDIAHIRADYAQMQMVLSAILANSNEAIEDEGLIGITAENKNPDERFTKQYPGLKPGPYVCLTIEDDGKGMDEETKDGIFEPFFTTKFQGRGMGMAAVYGIVKNHDGWIFVDSELGKGTTVRIYLPAISAESKEQGAKAGEQPEIELAIGEGTILMIEDEDVVIEVTQAMLEWLGYRVMVAKTGKDAIHITETFDGQIDLALLDIKLPDMEGGKVYPLIMKARPDLKVIVFSGYAIEGPARKILDAGAQDFIQKPFSLATLSEKLKEVLEGK